MSDTSPLVLGFAWLTIQRDLARVSLVRRHKVEGKSTGSGQRWRVYDCTMINSGSLHRIDPVYLPVIVPTAFEGFRRLMSAPDTRNEFPATYEAWSDGHRQRLALYRRHICVPVTPDQFGWYCHANSRPRNFNSLLELTEVLGRILEIGK